jgi:hypothetical protein
MLKATVSGSFHRHMDAISSAVQALTDRGVQVISPADPRVVEARGDFLFVASDRVRSVRLVQDRHLESIRSSDFLWLVAPDGYVGQSASMEMGFAIASDIPVYGLALPHDLTLRQYVSIVGDIRLAIAEAKLRTEPRRRKPGFLIDPRASFEEAHAILDEMSSAFSDSSANIDDSRAEDIYASRDKLTGLFLTSRRND